ncbi:MAG: hypothetical protein LBE50_03945 [Gallionellaceae bacterium]|nr:hypothetical protein [Gallionellaceae bacterium]
MTRNQIVKEQLWHILFGTLLFAAIAAVAVLLDLAASRVGELGTSVFTQKVLEYTAHWILLVDLALFLVYLASSSWRLLREMTK